MARIPKAFESTWESYSRGEQIGSGGTGSVFSCTDSSGRALAVKVLLPQHVTKDRLARFPNETSFCKRDQGENVLRVLDDGYCELDAKKCPFYVMDRYPGTLRQQFDRGLDGAHAMRLVDDLLRGLEIAHMQGVWHRDLKPENVLISDSGRAVIADFGIAHFAADQITEAVHTRITDRLANWRYAAPEQRESNPRADQRSDLYALGLIVNEAFTKSVIQGTGYRRISEVAPDYSYLDTIIEKLVQQDSSKRFNDVPSVIRELAAQRLAAGAQAEIQHIAARTPPKPPGAEGNCDIRLEQVLDFDSSAGWIEVRLNQEIPDGWMNWFQNPNSHTYTMSFQPQMVTMRNPQIMVIPARSEREAQQNIDRVKEWIPLASADLKRRLEGKAAESYRQEVERRAAEIKRAQDRESVIRGIKL